MTDPNTYKPSNDGITFLPLGGCGQFGANFNLYGYDGQWLAVDCGIAFADERLPGVDILVPDVRFLAERKDKLLGLVITHAHEDHIGAVARVWDQLQCPIYAPPFAIEVLKRKFSEVVIKGSKPEFIEFTDQLDLGQFELQTIPVSHSIPEAYSLAITTKTGTVLHSGDWNLDPHPLLGAVTDEGTFRALGDRGVLAYIGDSTNAPVDGFSKSESEVAPSFEKLFKECKGRICVTLFSSNIARVIGIHNAAKASGRFVCLSGRSLANIVDNARACGYITDDMHFISDDDAQNKNKNQVVYIVTGSQGEDRAALAKISRGQHPRIRLDSGDTVFFSARSIPGNERGIIDLKNNLIESHVRVIDPDSVDEVIHVSGHPRRGEIETMLSWVKPKALIAVHGEPVQQQAQAALHKNSIVPTNGQILLIKSDGEVETKGFVETDLKAVDFDRVVDLDHGGVNERRKMSFNGSVMVSLVYDIVEDDILDLQITTLGLLDQKLLADEKHLEKLDDHVEQAIIKLPKKMRKNEDAFIDKITSSTKRYFRNLLNVRPIVSVHVTLLD